MARDAKVSSGTSRSTAKDAGQIRHEKAKTSGRWMKRDAESGKYTDRPVTKPFRVAKPAVTSKRFSLSDARAAVRKLFREERADK